MSNQTNYNPENTGEQNTQNTENPEYTGEQNTENPQNPEEGDDQEVSFHYDNRPNPEYTSPRPNDTHEIERKEREERGEDPDAADKMFNSPILGGKNKKKI
ncbi:hypothetical protein EBR43_12850 [bacterium]|nr:hypothetical protein [bacterium]